MTTKKALSTSYVSSSCPRVITHYLLEQKASREKIESILGCPLDSLESVEFRLPIENLNRLWEYAVKYTKQPDLGLKLGTRKVEDEVGLVGHIFFSNATISDALTQYQRYFSVTNENISINIQVSDDQIELQFLCIEPAYYSLYDMERTIAAGITRTREHLKRKLPLRYIGFQHAAPAHYERYNALFECPIRFSQPCCSIAFDKTYLDYRLPHRSSYLQKVLSKHLETVLSKIKRKTSFTDKIELMIEKRLANDSIDAEHIAQKLNMSRNTLYRRLQAEDISFHDLVDKVRKRKAIAYLRQGSLSISQIAFLLGFSELSAFSRAFKRWTGKSPAKYLESDN